MKRRYLIYLTFFSAVLVVLLHGLALKHSLYWYLPWLDVIVHLFTGFCLANFFFIIFNSQFLLSRFSNNFEFISLLVVLLIALIWELFEFKTGLTFSSDNYALDTSLDIFSTFIGAVIAVVVYKKFFK